jgi:hypothetical protein
MSTPKSFKESLQGIMVYQIHDTDYSALTGQDKLSVDQAVAAIIDLVERDIIGEDQAASTDEWECPCGRRHSITEHHTRENYLRKAQRKALRS